MDAARTPTSRARARVACLVVGLFAPLVATAPAPASAATPKGPSTVRSKAAWDRDTGTAARKRPGKQALVAPRHYAAFSLDPAKLEDVLGDAPRERTKAARTAPLVVSVPTPEGDFARFAIAESPVMAPALAAKHPEIRTYAGRGLDDPTATIRLDLTPLGFHSAVRDARGSWYVDPRYRDQMQYVAYARDAVTADPAQEFVEREGAVGDLPAPLQRTGEAPGAAVKLRTYRLALVSDPTYATAPAVAGNVTAAKATLMNRVNQLYEADFAIRMQLIAGNDALNLDTDAVATGVDGPCGATACFTSAELAACDVPTLDRMDVVAGLLAGARNFDIGHLVLGRNGGGIANLGVVGDEFKAGGCTGLTNPIGDAFAVDYVAHEMGHQFGGDHTFNGTQDNCSAGNRAPGTSVEPGSGTTVMAYAGICGTDDTQPHSDPYFSQASIAQMGAYVLSTGTSLTSVQQAALTGFTTGDSFKLTYDSTTSSTIVRVGDDTTTATSIKNAVASISSRTVSSVTVDDSGFVVTFGTAGDARPLGLTSVSGFTGYVNDIRVGGPPVHGGSAVTGPNHAPQVTTAPAFTVPARTPFTLTAAGSDVDGGDDAALTYLWEQNDTGAALAGTGLVSNAKPDGPLFRVFGTAARYDQAAAELSPSPGENSATGDRTRTFPDLPQILSGNTNAATGSCPTASVPPTTTQVDCFSEFLPTATWLGSGNRILHFRVTARDNRLSDGGGVASADTALTVAPLAGPFRVTSQAAPQTLPATAPLTVTWDVANTSAAPVSTTSVKISLSTDGGATFLTVLEASTPNDGSQAVSLPVVATTQGRIKVEAVGNVFFDVSRADLTITVAPGLSASPLAFGSVVAGTADTRDVQLQNGSATPRTVGQITLDDSPAFTLATGEDGCSGQTLPAGTGCLVAVRFAPATEGDYTGTLSAPSDDPGSPLSFALTGTATAPPPPPDPDPPVTTGETTPTTTTSPSTTTTTTTTPTAVLPTPPSAAQRGSTLATGALGRQAVALAVLGRVRLYGTTTSNRLGRPVLFRRLAVAVCLDAPCTVTATASLATTDRRRKVTRRAVRMSTLRMAANTARSLTLRLPITQRRAIKRARSATITVTVRADGRRFVRTYRFTVG